MSCPLALSLVLLAMPGMCRDMSRGYGISQRLEGWGHGRPQDDRYASRSPPYTYREAREGTGHPGHWLISYFSPMKHLANEKMKLRVGISRSFDRSIVLNQKGSVWSTRPLAPKHLKLP